MNKEKMTVWISLFTFLAVFMIVSIYTVERNPDPDAFFLIENGRYITENHALPKINPWNINEGMGIVLQQPLCSLINYGAFMLWGLQGMWRMAVIENLILLFCLFQLLGCYTNDLSRKLNTLTIFDSFMSIGGFITTRPYQLTMAISICELILLYKYFKNRQTGRRISFRFLSGMFLLAMLQASYQSSFIIMLFIWPLCYYVPDIRILIKEKSIFSFIKQGITGFGLNGLCLYGTLFCGSLCNPNGINGMLYLFKAKEAMNKCSSYIGETQAPAIWSVGGIMIGLLFILYQKNTDDDPGMLYKCLGTGFLASIAYRNAWMSMIIAATLWAGSSLQTDEESKHSTPATPYLYIGSIICCIVICMLPLQSKEMLDEFYHEDAVTYLSNFEPEELTLYTTFDTGAIFEFAGIKVYMDARPELYTPQTTGWLNLLEEWYNIEVEKNDSADIADFIERYGFTHFEVNIGSRLDTYLKYTPGYREICRNKHYILYEKEK